MPCAFYVKRYAKSRQLKRNNVQDKGTNNSNSLLPFTLSTPQKETKVHPDTSERNIDKHRYTRSCP